MSQQNPTPGSEIILYQTEDGRTRLEVKLTSDTVWLPLNQIAELFQRDKSVISKHLKNIFDEGELKAEATVAKFATVQNEGKRTVSRAIEFYNLDAIIAVGYRVKSHRGTQFHEVSKLSQSARARATSVAAFPSTIFCAMSGLNGILRSGPSW